MTINRRRWLKKNPAPPPTPEGMVWATRVTFDRYGYPLSKRTELVPAEEFKNYVKQDMDRLDQLTPQERARVYDSKTGDLPEYTSLSIGTTGFSLGVRLK